MKKLFFVYFLTVAMLLSSFSVQIYAQSSTDEVGVFFDANNNILEISGTIGDTANSTVTVHISEYTDTQPVFSHTEPPIASYLFFTKDGGLLSEQVKISDSLRNNKYAVHFYYNDNDTATYKKDSFIFFNQSSEEAELIVKQLNKASSDGQFTSIVLNNDNALALGIDLSKITEHSAYAASLAYNLRSIQTDSEYTTLTFYNTFSGCIAASIIKNNHNLDEAVSTYYSALGTTYEEYSALSSGEKAELATLMENADYTKKSIADIYSEKLQVAKFKLINDGDAFKTALLANSNFGVSETDSNYLKIQKTYRPLVFSDMFKERGSYTSFEDVLNSFNNKVQANYKLYGITETPVSRPPSSSSGGVSSNISSGTNILVPDPDITPTTPVAPQKNFADTKGHWAEESIDYLIAKDAINGFPDGTFKPNETVTRAQFAQILRLAFSLYANSTNNFDDVAKDDWYYESINILSALKLVNGYGSSFAPNDNIKREDMAVIIYRLCSYLNIKLDNNGFSFSDDNEISDYAKEAVSCLSANSLLKGDNGMFHPQRQLSRAEAATIIERICKIYEGGAE